MFKKSLFIICITLIFNLNIYGQTPTAAQKDSLISEMCLNLKENLQLSDSSKMHIIYTNYFSPFLNNFPQTQHELIGTSLYYRAQRVCKEYKEILDRMNPDRVYQKVKTVPKQIINKKECAQFRDIENLYYTELNGDTVDLKISNGYWVDKFKDGTYSKLKLRWIDDCSFEIEFIESNNELRMNFSYPGDKYRYTLIEKRKNHYFTAVEIIGTDQLEVFNLFVK